jgi:hypothetical protein
MDRCSDVDGQRPPLPGWIVVTRVKVDGQRPSLPVVALPHAAAPGFEELAAF